MTKLRFEEVVVELADGAARNDFIENFCQPLICKRDFLQTSLSLSAKVHPRRRSRISE
jgi:hypothetical protein